MTLSNFAGILQGTGIPARYGYWSDKDRPTGNYIEYEATYTQNFGAVNRVYKIIQHLDVFLFTKTKDQAAEASVEYALDDAGIFWDKTETWLDDERVYQILYEVSYYGE